MPESCSDTESEVLGRKYLVVDAADRELARFDERIDALQYISGITVVLETSSPIATVTLARTESGSFNVGVETDDGKANDFCAGLGLNEALRRRDAFVRDAESFGYVVRKRSPDSFQDGR